MRSAECGLRNEDRVNSSAIPQSEFRNPQSEPRSLFHFQQRRLTMTYATSQLLAPKTIQKAISQLELPGTSLQTLFGWGLGGTNVARQGGRNFAYDIFNVTRKVATSRVPAQSLAVTKPQSVSTKSATYPRSAERIQLLDEELLNRRPIGGPDGGL